MNRFINKLTLIFGVAFSSVSFAQWSPLLSGDGFQILNALPRFDSSNQFVYVSTLTNYDKAQKFESANGSASYLSKDETVILNCKNKTYSIPDYSLYTGSNGKGNVVFFQSVKPDMIKWLPISSAVMALKLNEQMGKRCSG
jgi:hypothetical protein